MNYNKLIVLIIVVLLIAAASVLLLSGHSVSKEDSVVKILSNNTLNTNDSIKIKLSDLNNNPIANENVAISIYDSNGSLVSSRMVKTGYAGEASLNLTNVSEGDYKVNITFEGNDKYNGCGLSRNFKVIAPYVEETVQGESVSTGESYDASSSYYSTVEERTISAGEVELGPDGNYWRHNGNNEWEVVG